jgi:hypothetical protein
MKNVNRFWLWCRDCSRLTWHNEKNICLRCHPEKGISPQDLPQSMGHARKQEKKDADKGNDAITAG